MKPVLVIALFVVLVILSVVSLREAPTDCGHHVNGVAELFKCGAFRK